MKNISISTFINIVFAVAFFAITLAFVFFITIDRQKYVISQHQRYDVIAESLLQKLTSHPTQEQLTLFMNNLPSKRLAKEKRNLILLTHLTLNSSKIHF